MIFSPDYDSVQRSAAELSAVRANLTERLQAKVSSLTEQRDRLNTSLQEVNKELNCESEPSVSRLWPLHIQCRTAPKNYKARSKRGCDISAEVKSFESVEERSLSLRKNISSEKEGRT